MDGISQRLMLALQGMTPMFVGKDFHSQSKSLATVSYTHLDVYKRQLPGGSWRHL